MTRMMGLWALWETAVFAVFQAYVRIPAQVDRSFRRKWIAGFGRSGPVFGPGAGGQGDAVQVEGGQT